MITRERLNELFEYNEHTGDLIRKITTGNRSKKGSIAGNIDNYGYLGCGVDGKRYQLHRLIWLMVYGSMPPKGTQVDHIDRNKINNRLDNLRLLSIQEQARNRNLEANRELVIGIAIEYRNGKDGRKNAYYRPYISPKKGVQIKLGYFTDYVEAVCMRYAAEQCLGWEEFNLQSSAAVFIKNYLKRTKVPR